MATTVTTYGDGFMKHDPDELFVFEMIYDSNGVYRGQNQENMIESGILFLSANIIDGVPYVEETPVAPLSAEEMSTALEAQAELDRKFRR